MTTLLPSGPSWEDQIVPTLRKRLENESAYLTHRLSSKNVMETTPYSPSPSLLDEPRAFPASSILEARDETGRDPASPRNRTKSTPFVPSGSSTSRRPLPGARAGSSRSNSASPTKEVSESDKVLQEQRQSNSTQTHFPSTKQDDSLPPSRIPTRPRSKSQLGPRPGLIQNNSSSNAPPLPLGIPLPSTSRRGSSPSKIEKLTASQNSSRRPSYRSDSPDMLKGRKVEGLVKNELPPFMMFQEDAMRIAERGHDLDSDSERDYGLSATSRRGQEEGRYDGLSRSVGTTEATSSKRQRSITMRPDSRSSFDMDTSTRLDKSRKPGIGLGQPSGSTALRKTATTNRSASSRTPQNQPGGTGNGFAPRSASLNLLSSTAMGTPSSASSSRLGVAAHLVPPENTYTPPKGANWDEVVLPTVAKKLGMTETEREEGGEGDLAVEWDRDGVPIKWAKRGLNTSQSSHAGLSVGDTNLATSHSFSPTFEPSPDNPLRSQTTLPAPPRSHSRTNSLHHRTSNQSLNSTPVPIRTTRGHPIDLILEPPLSPAPFCDLIPAPPGWQSQLKRKESDNSVRGIGRKPSLLRKQTSQLSMRNVTGPRASPAKAGTGGYGGTGIMTPERAASGQGMGYFDNPRPAPAQPRQQSSTTGQLPVTGRGREHNQFGQPPISSETRPSKGRSDGEHSKGCGCVIM